MNDQNTINFTNLVNKKSKDPIYITIVIGVILACVLIVLVFFTDMFKSNKKVNHNDNPIVTPSDDNTATPEDNTATPEDIANLDQIGQAKLSLFLSNVKSLYNSSLMKYISEYQNGKIIEEVSPIKNSIDTKLNYCVKMNDGKVIKLQAEDSLFSVEINNINNVNDIKVNYVKKGKLSKVDCEQKVK